MDDLGLQRTSRETQPASESRSSTTGAENNGAATRALVLGGLLLSSEEANNEESETDEDFTLIWVTGAMLGHGRNLHWTAAS